MVESTDAEWQAHWERLAKRAKQERENEEKKQKEKMVSVSRGRHNDSVMRI